MGDQFDPTVIQTFAERLLVKARSTAILWGLIGAGFGLIAAAGVGKSTNAIAAVAVLGTSVCIGVAIGQARSFSLKLAAHQALWQVAVERHLARLVSESGMNNASRVA